MTQPIFRQGQEPVCQIALTSAKPNSHRSTVYREIKRNYFTDEELPYLNGYYVMNAQQDTSDRRARRRKLIRLVDLRAHVIAPLKIGWTPEQIAGRLGYDDQPLRISHETIYAYVYSAEGQSEQLARHLPGRRKKRQPRYARRPRGQVFPPERSIHERPDYVKTRETFGDWEGDLMIFERSQGTMNAASLVERKTRFAFLFRNNDRSSTHFSNKLMDVMEPLPQPEDWASRTGDAGLLASQPPQPVKRKQISGGTSNHVMGYLPAGWQLRTRWNMVDERFDRRQSFPVMKDNNISDVTADTYRDATNINNCLRSAHLLDYQCVLDFFETSYSPIPGAKSSLFSGAPMAGRGGDIYPGPRRVI